MVFTIAFWKINFFSEKLGSRLYFTSRRSPFWPIETFPSTSCPVLCEFISTTEFFKYFPVICSYDTISNVYKLLSIDDAARNTNS